MDNMTLGFLDRGRVFFLYNLHPHLDLGHNWQLILFKSGSVSSSGKRQQPWMKVLLLQTKNPLLQFWFSVQRALASPLR